MSPDSHVSAAARWRKSSYSGRPEQQCVEVAPLGSRVGVRDTKNRAGGIITAPAAAWTAVLGAIRADRL